MKDFASVGEQLAVANNVRLAAVRSMMVPLGVADVHHGAQEVGNEAFWTGEAFLRRLKIMPLV